MEPVTGLHPEPDESKYLGFEIWRPENLKESDHLGDLGAGMKVLS
jgi:hypothetical protein